VRPFSATPINARRRPHAANSAGDDKPAFVQDTLKPQTFFFELRGDDNRALHSADFLVVSVSKVNVALRGKSALNERLRRF
jgi:hypothetical protein